MSVLKFINQRKNQGNNSTIGDVYQVLDDGSWKWFAHIIEDDAKGVKGDYRMPEGIYPLRIHPAETPKTIFFRQHSWPELTRFIEMVDVQVPKRFDLVFFHPGNDQNDTEGCQTLNDQMGNNNILVAKEGVLSLQATKRFYSIVEPVLQAGGKVFYEIRDEYQLWKK